MLVVVSRIDAVENAKHSVKWTVHQYYLHLDVLPGGYAVWNCVAIGQISVDDSKFMLNYCIVNQISAILFTDLGLNVMGFGWYSLEPLYNKGLGYVDFLAGRGWSAFAVFQPEACHGKFEPTSLLMWRFNDLVYISFMRSPGISCWVKMEHRGALIPWENVLAVRIGLSISTFLPIMLR